MDFSKLTAYVDSLGAVGVPGCDIAVFKDHAQIYRHRAGHRDDQKAQPMRGDETYCLYSVSKLFTTCSAMQLIERGKLCIDDPVSLYLPEYAHLTVNDGGTLRPARRAMTIGHLMSMQSGLDYETESPEIISALRETGYTANARQIAHVLSTRPLSFDPGDDFLYSLSHDVLAAVIEVAGGMRFSDYLKQNIFEPLGLKTIGFDIKDPERQCAQYLCDEDTGAIALVPSDTNVYRFGPNYESGGAGLISDVDDVIAFLDALACNEGTLLSPETVQLWRANRLGPVSRRSFDTWGRKGYSYALGCRTRVSTDIGGRGQIGEFGWDGAAGAWAMIDPVNRISAFFAMHVRSFNYSYDVIHPTLRDLIYRALD